MNQAKPVSSGRSPIILLAALLAIFRIPAALAQAATLDNDILTLHELKVGSQYFVVELQMIPSSEPLAFSLVDFAELSGPSLENPNLLTGNLLEVPAILIGGLSYWVKLRLQEEPGLQLILEDFGLNADAPGGCVRPEPDASHGSNNPQVINGFSVSTEFLFDGGPGQDGIPSIDVPVFEGLPNKGALDPDQLVVGVKMGDAVRAYPHYVLDWHEIVNDRYTLNGEAVRHTLSYCPLTGSAMMWKGDLDGQPVEFGVSGLLLNSNLILYDRNTGSRWSQMLEQSINGPSILTIPERVQVIETTWETWRIMYPQSELLTSFTGHDRPYETYPYGDFRTSEALRFPVENSDDRRLPRKERVVGINVGDTSRVYPIKNFSNGVTVINEKVGDTDVVVVGSGNSNFGAVYSRQMEDCSTLEFSAVADQLPVVMSDNEGNQWDIFGVAVSGPRIGQSLQKTNSYIAYWYAWTAFFAGTTIWE